MHKTNDSVNFTAFLAQQPAPAPTAAPAGGGAGSLVGLLPFVLMFAAMYFLMIAPQRKKAKQHAKLLESLASGDEVLTAGGIFGTVTSVKPDRVVLRVSDTAKIEVAKTYVQNVLKKADKAESAA